MDSLTPSVERQASPRIPLPTFRSGAAARMAGMPVATLRLWEQRYQAVQPSTGMPTTSQAPIRLFVVGQTRAQRLKRLAAGQNGLQAAQVVACFDTLMMRL